jgi:hypothetical protein
MLLAVFGPQVDAYARSRNLEVVGLYHANEVVDDTRLCSAACTIADKLQQQSSPHAVIFLVGNLRNDIESHCTRHRVPTMHGMEASLYAI